MKINNVKDQLKRDEGTVLHAYQDHLGYWTIGVGRLIDKRKGGGITEDEADYLLNNDISKRAGELENRIPWFNDLDLVRQGALINMSFQLGVEGLLGFKTTLSLIREHKFNEASEQALKSLWARQTPNRARRIAAQIAEGVWK